MSVAGDQMMAALIQCARPGGTPFTVEELRENLPGDIAAIEAEARDAALAEAEAAVAALPAPDAEYPWVPITTVLDAIAALRSGGAG